MLFSAIWIIKLRLSPLSYCITYSYMYIYNSYIAYVGLKSILFLYTELWYSIVWNHRTQRNISALEENTKLMLPYEQLIL